jgi:hypothetical protein
MPIQREHDVDDDGSGLTGTIRDAAWKERLYDQIDAAIAPAWQSAEFSHLSDDAGTTLSHILVVSRYVRLAPTTVAFSFRVDSITLPASTSAVYINNLPFFCKDATFVNAVTYGSMPLFVEAVASSRLRIKKMDLTAIAPGTYYVGFTSLWEVNP